MAQKNKKAVKQTKSNTPYIRGFWILFFGSFGVLILIFLLASWGVFGSLPTFDELARIGLAT